MWPKRGAALLLLLVLTGRTLVILLAFGEGHRANLLGQLGVGQTDYFLLAKARRTSRTMFGVFLQKYFFRENSISSFVST